ncbi:hypothetical protein I3843_12G061500 [Carya illinoinensis]|uniref:Uncharacterized protein n=1 Tax=Carya illinoinensis TaxID=32201 RepID=A0A8T1NXF5_CARIL|nr:uncharacterized protein LOC122289467 [Carya illinoinensis]KAG6633643.1 hypothetical protein CIPAW_12G062400 [Carya illinoinensis]KAG6684390.1 hypothetical protein I3842_12G060600 [Carya illinoinensis]KAG7952482.1 hypothetical protein I3843_12G061500 [Carya illinoinensis]
MGLFRKIAGFLGLGKDDGHETRDEEGDEDNNNNSDTRTHDRAPFQETGLPRRGFGVPIQVVVDRSQLGPILVPCNPSDGGIQGLRWYAKRLRIDEDGDVADEFIDELLPERLTNKEDHPRPFPRFEVKNSTRPAKVKNLVLSANGKIQCVEHQGGESLQKLFQVEPLQREKNLT